MTAPERLAKVAEVLAGHTPVYDYRNGHFTMECEACDFILGGVDRAEAKRRFGEHFVGVLAPLLDEFQAEDEARGAARVREAVEALAETWEAKRFYDVAAMQLRNSFTRDLRAALDAAEKENHDG